VVRVALAPQHSDNLAAARPVSLIQDVEQVTEALSVKHWRSAAIPLVENSSQAVPVTGELRVGVARSQDNQVEHVLGKRNQVTLPEADQAVLFWHVSGERWRWAPG
jgi:hypothetical protein